MQPKVLLLEKADVSDVVAQCVCALRQGALLVLPTETVYGLGALASNADAVSRLCVQKERQLGHALPLAVSSFAMAREYVDDLSPLAERLARHFWPGPLTLVVDASHSSGKLQTLPKGALNAIMPRQTCGFRVPRNDFLCRVIDAVGAPLVLTSANLSGRSPALTAQEAKESLGPRVDLVVDGGPATYGLSSTVAKLSGKEITILREGVISSENLQNAAIKTNLFVCAANMCRSPVAEVIARKIIAERLNIPPDELEANGVRVVSAGIIAPISRPAPPVVRRFVQKFYGVTLDSHLSKGIDSSLVRYADNIFTMEKAQSETLRALYPEHADRITTLDPSGHDVADPFGGTGKDYRTCFKTIESLVKIRLNQLL